MCGIAGILCLNQPPTDGLIQKMTAALSHRGPDAEGFYVSPKKHCHLGHRRLSIIDLSDEANQPMISDCGDYSMVYNGEVYNYEALKERLIDEYKIEFHTTSDSEVVLKAFIALGLDFVNELNGMFSIAIYHKPTQQLFVFRDRLGIKPLYYYYQDGVFAFASEIQGLLPLTEEYGKFTLSNQAINEYFRLGYIPEPNSIYKEVHKFKSGHYGIVDESGFELKKYWKPSDEIKPELLTDELLAKSKLKELINESVSLRLKSDVPFGVFLSGGIDSSVVAAVAQSKSEAPIKTFSIGFKEASYNESEAAKKIATTLGTDHHEFEVSYDDAQAIIPDLQKMFGEPFSDASAIPTHLVSKLAKDKVTMVLTGDGGDEQFMGYGMYNWAKRLNNPMLQLFKQPIHFMLKNSGNNRMKRASEMFNYQADTNLLSHIFSVDQYLFSKNELKQLLPSNYFSKLELIPNDLSRNLSPMENQALFDIEYYLKDDLLTKVDRASMSVSLEARVPLLDDQIVSFSLNLDEKLKVKNGTTKYLLKEVLYDYLPRSLFDRPKWGFGLPLRFWLANELKPVLDQYINAERLAEISFLNSNYILQLKKRYLSGEDFLYNKLWSIMMLIQWMEEYQNYYKLDEK